MFSNLRHFSPPIGGLNDVDFIIQLNEQNNKMKCYENVKKLNHILRWYGPLLYCDVLSIKIDIKIK